MSSSSCCSDTRAIVSNKAIDYMGKAIYGIDSERGLLGLSQNRVKMADEVLKAQADIVKLNLDDLEGVDVYEASNGREALSKLEMVRAELVILDVMMPEMDGWELCRRLRQSIRRADPLKRGIP